MFSRREMIAATLLAISNDAFARGLAHREKALAANENGGKARPRFDSTGDASVAVVASAVKVIPGFIVALRESPIREDLLAAADIIMSMDGKVDNHDRHDDCVEWTTR